MSSKLATRQTILLVDDEQDILLELAEMLELEGYRCILANSVAQAFEQLSQHPDIALIITDLRMPEESGLRLIQQLRARSSRKQLPVIVASGHADMNDVIDTMRLQAVDFFIKPIYHERLLESIERLFPSTLLHLAK
ncbi:MULTISPECIES: response regulator [Pseudomonas]|uniref:Histidine kinase n=1 Tax=Pseudomonas marincola TaxID=437900 RepID=A0A1I7D4D4_9PSED|nr:MULTISPECIES: response regulator [Pseudomonas]MBQ57211.1 histidine kinase [Pseudomonadaceae bacterium]OEO23386.1 histidine kinase [Pseudomonas sp. J237]CAE6889353.1 Histidine kinase [Pseudomonas marincola]SFU06575.1 Response regulator receiver domain-containing protein [Pseudomonas marincola]HCP55849.1 histidine kinase [Pseudomonas sp.]|tara:strand:- start:86 stop:496 length:411 start_codon:yes stop_codon:yes gene_type:complete